MEPLSFSVRRSVQKVILEDENGNLINHELREMSAAARDKHLDQLNSRMARDTSGKPAGVKNYEGFQAALITLCLFKEGEKEPVSKEEVQKWSASATTQIYEAAQKLNRLDNGEGETKND